jgi:hypothetical protein
MPFKKPRLLTPDGKLEMRTPDEMLRDAVSGESYAQLPGKGKPLNLREFFSSDAEHRMAGKILRDNQVLPPQLQERKDAEFHLRDAETQLREATERILPLRGEIYRSAQQVPNAFPNSETVQKILGLDHLPNDFPSKPAESGSYSTNPSFQPTPRFPCSTSMHLPMS